MRIILKPGGFLLVFLTIGILAGVAIYASKSKPTATRGNSRVNSSAAGGGNSPQHSAGQLISPTAQSWSLAIQEPAAAKMSLFVADDLPEGNDRHALHLEILAVDPNKYWAAQLLKVVPDPVLMQHRVVVHFWGRSRTNNKAYIVFEEGKPPHTPQLLQLVSFTPRWQEYNFPFTTTKDNTIVHANFCVKASITPGEIDIAQIYVEDKDRVQ